MLEVKGELVFKTVAYHRAADAIGRSPVDLVAAYRSGQAARDPGRRQGDQRQDRGARDDRPDGLLRPAARRGPAQPRRAAAHPGARAEDRPPDLRRSSASRPSRTCARPPRPAGCATCAGMSSQDRGSSSSRASPGSTTSPTGCSSTRAEEIIDGAHRRAADDARASARSSPPARSAAGASRSATSTSSPRPTTADGADRARSPRSASSIRSSTRAATRRRSGCCAARRST